MSNLQDATSSQLGKQTAENDFGLLKFAASTVASLTLILILLGFGVSLAVESKLALPHSSLYESSVELLDLGSVAVIQILPKLFENLGKIGTYFEMITSAWHSLWGAILLSAIIIALVFTLKYVIKVNIKAHQEKAKALLAEGGKHGFLARSGLFLLLLCASLLSPIFLYFGLAFAMVLLAFVPMIGWFAGMAYIDEVAINDRVCSPLPSVQYYQARKAEQIAKKLAEPKEQPRTVQCIKVLKDDDEVASGRLVISTSKAMVLYLPDGSARRVPIGDSVIEVIDKLPTKDTQTSSPAKPQSEASHTAK